MNVISVLIGLLVFVLALVGFVPFLGWLNWFVIPMAIVGAVVGMLSSKTSGRNLNIFLILACALRLFLGGGIF
ncbi:MAG: hypothetical protein ABIS14_11840 [Sphingomonas sp.]